MRTKTGPLPSLKTTSSSSTTDRKESKKRYALEAQLENSTEDNPITLTLVHLTTTPGFGATSLNWEIVLPDKKEGVDGEGEIERPVLGPGDVRQVCFLVEEKDTDAGDDEGGGEEKGKEMEIVDGRLIFGVLSIGWRGAMGNKGFLSTGNLGIRVK